MFRNNVIDRLIGKPLPKVSYQELIDAVPIPVAPLPTRLAALKEFELRTSKNNVTISNEIFEFPRPPRVTGFNIAITGCRFSIEETNEFESFIYVEGNNISIINCIFDTIPEEN